MQTERRWFCCSFHFNCRFRFRWEGRIVHIMHSDPGSKVSYICVQGSAVQFLRSLIAFPFLQLLPSVFFFISLIWQWKIIWNCRLSSVSLDRVIYCLGIVDLCVLIMFSHLIVSLRRYLFSSLIDFLGSSSEPRNNAYYEDGQPRSINIVGGQQKQAM